MKFHGIEMQGSFKNQIVSSLPAGGDATNKGRTLYNDTDESIYIADNSGDWSNGGGIPPGEIILFESDVEVLGFSLQADVDDQLIYISSGGVAGQKPGSTWTQPNHDHGAGAHTHTYSGATGFEISLSDVNLATGGTGRHYHTYSGTTDAGAGQTDGSATANSWRPEGRNFTRQEKS